MYVSCEWPSFEVCSGMARTLFSSSHYEIFCKKRYAFENWIFLKRASKTNRVCKCGCDFDTDNYGMCKANFRPFYKSAPAPDYRACDVQRPPFINTGFPPSSGSSGKGFLRIEKDFGDRMVFPLRKLITLKMIKMVVENTETNNAVNMRSMSPVVSNSGPKVIRRRRKDH